jgi:hypothetical protein
MRRLLNHASWDHQQAWRTFAPSWSSIWPTRMQLLPYHNRPR